MQVSSLLPSIPSPPDTYLLIKVVLDVNFWIEQILPIDSQVHLIEYQILKRLLEIRLPDENSALHSPILHHSLHVLFPGCNSDQQFVLVVQCLALEQAQQNHLKKKINLF